MALFRGFFGGGGGEEERDESGGEVVEKLIERVDTSTALEDRRDALRALRSIAKKMRLHVGTLGINVFMDILEKEQNNPEIFFMALDILVAVLSSDDEATDEDELGERLAELMLRKPHFIPAVLAAVDQFDFSVRKAAVALLTSILRHRGSEAQNLIIQQPTAITKLVDLLHENREIVRNEAVLMLCELSRANCQVQQMLAYDNAFTLLFDVIDSEPLDSIVIEDCLFVIINLLRKNSMNQQLFRENNLIPRLGIVLHQFLYGEQEEEDLDAQLNNGSVPPPSADNWPKQRTANVIFLLQILRSLVAPDNAAGITHAAQKVMHQCKMLAELCKVLLSEMGVGVDVLTESVVAVAEIIRGNYTNQEYFAATSLETESGELRPSLIVLLVSMTSERQPFKLRCAVFYCFLSYLYDNEFAKTKVIETLLPATQNENVLALTSGTLICQAISSAESIQVWFGCISLLHCVVGVEHLREQLLRVQLTVGVDDTIGLLHHSCQMLISAGNRRPQTRAGLLQLLGAWMHECPPAVAAFASHEENLHHLTAQMLDESGEGTESEQQVLKGLIAFLLLTATLYLKDEKGLATLTALLERRVGRDRLADAIEGVSRTEQFVRAAQKAQPLAKAPNELFLDFHFVKIFKSAEGKVLKWLRGGDSLAAGSSSNNEAIIQSFKDLIKRQDEEISVLKQETKKLQAENQNIRKENDKAEVERALADAQARLQQVTLESQNTAALHSQIASLSNVNAQWRAEVDKYKAWTEQWSSYQIAQLPNGGMDAVVQQLRHEHAQLDQQLAYGWQAFETQSQQIAALSGESEHWKGRAASAEQRAAELERQLHEEAERRRVEEHAKPKDVNGHAEEQESAASSELIRLHAEQEDLLVLLADQHGKISHYRKKLRALGQPVSDDDDDE